MHPGPIRQSLIGIPRPRKGWFPKIGYKAVGAYIGIAAVAGICLYEGLGMDTGLFSWTKRLEKNYRERIRRYSHPAKVFGKFASVNSDAGKLMTVEDLVYMLLGIKITFADSDDKSWKAKQLLSVRDFLKRFDTTGDGLFNYTEYLLTLTFFYLPIEHMKQSFKIMDLNDDGYLSKEELKNFLKSNCKFVDYFHRMGYVEYMESLNKDPTGIFKMFFGEKEDKRMKYSEFIDFLQELKTNILKLEFYRFDVDEKTDSINSADFIKALLTYSSSSRLEEFEEKIKNLKEGPRVTFEMYKEFDRCITQKAMSIEFVCKLCPAMFPKCDLGCLKRVFHKVAGTKLDDQQISAIFDICRRLNDKSNELDCNLFYDFLVKGRLYKGYSHG